MHGKTNIFYNGNRFPNISDDMFYRVEVYGSPLQNFPCPCLKCIFCTEKPEFWIRKVPKKGAYLKIYWYLYS
jgi:hypothetical protein